MSRRRSRHPLVRLTDVLMPIFMIVIAIVGLLAAARLFVIFVVR